MNINISDEVAADLEVVEGLLINIFGEKVKGFNNLSRESNKILMDNFNFLKDFSLVKNESGFFNGEYNLVETYNLLRACFILGSEHWEAVLFALQRREWLQGVSYNYSEGLLSPQSLLGCFKNTMPEDDFCALKEKAFVLPRGWPDSITHNLFALAVAEPILTLNSCFCSPLLRNDYNPVSRYNQIEIKKRLTEHLDFQREYIEIDVFTPIGVIRSEVKRLLDSIEEQQINERLDSEKEAVNIGTDWPDYLSWDHRKKLNGKTAPKTILGQALEYMEVYDIWKETRGSYSEIDKQRTSHYEEGHKRAKEHLLRAKELVDSALFGNFPPS